MELLIILISIGITIFYIVMTIRLIRAAEEIAIRSGVTTRILEDLVRQIKNKQ